MIEVAHDPQDECFVATVDGLDCRVRYHLDGPVLQVLSTFVPPVLEGQGIAAALTRAVIEHARERGLRVDPRCSYTAAYLRRHPQ
ncbi:MAG: N-acetyltransferase [Xanthomonadales bacterium]|nr:N-acetyltransferase [Xanthomonadales bacterium]